MKLIEAIAYIKQQLLKATSPFESQPCLNRRALDVAYRVNCNIQRMVILNKALEPLIFEVTNHGARSIMETTFNTADQMSTNWQTGIVYLKTLPEDGVVMKLYNDGMLYTQPEVAT